MIVIAPLALAGIAMPRAADACSPPRCTGGYLAPADGATVPTNVPALFVQRDWPTYLDPLDPASEYVLLDDQGGPAAVDFSPDTTFPGGADALTWVLVRPRAPLTVGQSYVARQTVACPEPGPNEQPTTRAARFTVGPKAPFPDSLGAVTTTRSRRESIRVWTSGGSCTTEIDAAVVDVAVLASDSLRPWLPVVRWTLYVDGQVWRSGGYGAIDGGPSDFPGTRLVSRLHARCTGGSMGLDDNGLTPGTHRAELSAHIAGTDAKDDVRQAFDVEVSCGEVDAGEPIDAGGDAGAPDLRAVELDAALEPGLVDHGCDCAVGAREERPPLEGIAIAALVGLIAARRRRRA